MRGFLAFAAMTALASSGARSAADVPWHTFDSDSQGWRFAQGSDSGAPASIALGETAWWDTRGNPGGAIFAPDYYGQTWIAAPAEFLGDQSGMYGYSFTYDMFVRASDNVPYTGVAITGAGLGLAYDGFVPAVWVWETRTVTFTESAWHIGGPFGPLATQDQLQSVLADLTGLFISTEWATGGDDTSIDNVGVFVPAPGSMVLLGAIAFPRAARRRCASA